MTGQRPTPCRDIPSPGLCLAGLGIEEPQGTRKADIRDTRSLPSQEERCMESLCSAGIPSVRHCLGLDSQGKLLTSTFAAADEKPYICTAK